LQLRSHLASSRSIELHPSDPKNPKQKERKDHFFPEQPVFPLLSFLKAAQAPLKPFVGVIIIIINYKIKQYLISTTSPIIVDAKLTSPLEAIEANGK
jgi:hypothetical protein